MQELFTVFPNFSVILKSSFQYERLAFKNSGPVAPTPCTTCSCRGSFVHTALSAGCLSGPSGSCHGPIALLTIPTSQPELLASTSCLLLSPCGEF